MGLQVVPGDLVVVCLGLNDHSGLKDKTGAVSEENSLKFRAVIMRSLQLSEIVILRQNNSCRGT